VRIGEQGDGVHKENLDGSNQGTSGENINVAKSCTDQGAEGPNCAQDGADEEKGIGSRITTFLAKECVCMT
jgi:hypothetical protein